ncbi:MAG: TolC family protein, partial [Fulvivirga sp.]
NPARLELLDLNLSTLDSLLRDTKGLEKEGFAEKIDVSRIQVQYNNLKVQVSNTKQLLELSYDLLKFQMGAGQDSDLTLTDKLEEVDFTVIEESGFDYNERIEYSQLQTNLALVNLDMKNNKVQYFPTLYANFNYGYNTQTGQSDQLFKGSRWLNFGAVGLSLSMPIFDGFLKSSRIQKNRIQAKQIEQSFDLLENSIDLEIKQAKVNMNTAIDNMVVQKENAALAREIYDIAKIKYQEGVGSNLEVTNADADYKEAQTNYYDALYAALVAKVELEKAYGRLNK